MSEAMCSCLFKFDECLKRSSIFKFDECIMRFVFVVLMNVSSDLLVLKDAPRGTDIFKVAESPKRFAYVRSNLMNV